MSAGIEEIHKTLLSEINTLETHSLDFLFSSKKHPYRDRDAITAAFEKEWQAIKPTLMQKDRQRTLASLLSPRKPYAPTVIRELQDTLRNSSLPRPHITLDICVRRILTEISGSYKKRVSPQLLVELLNFYKLRTPEFLIVLKPAIQIIVEKDKAFNHVIKSHACEILVNNYEIETLFIFISSMPDLKEEEKQILFQSLTAFQKIYRKLLELHVGIREKDLISVRWFGVSFDQLKQKRELRDSFSNLVRRFIEYLTKRNKMDALDIGRFLVLRFNNEDILRVIHHEITRDPHLFSQKALARFIYHQIFKVMQEFRKQYISQKVDAEVTQTLSETEARAMNAVRLITVGRAPISAVLKRLRIGIRPAHTYPILAEFMEKLDRFNLKALFELYPIPPISQEVINLIADIADSSTLAKDEVFHFITYLERLLVFLQDLEEIDVRVEKNGPYGLIKNPYQLKTINLIKEGAYFASTGLWYQNTIPPGIIRCIIPDAIPNCVGVRDRHIFCRISLLTGGFRGNPFDLDSTNRYDWDEEPETCLFRPGYFQITIPQHIRDRWGKTQNIQRAMLEELIQQKQWN